jgi:hypothetical protein
MELTVNNQQVRMNAFVQKVMHNLAQSILGSLDDVPEQPDDVIFSYQAGSGIEIRFGQEPLRLNEFVQRMTENVFLGVFRSLDDIPAEPQSFRLIY